MKTYMEKYSTLWEWLTAISFTIVSLGKKPVDHP